MKNYRNNHKRHKYRNNGDRNFQRNGNGHKLGADFNNNPNFKRKNHIRNNLNLSKLIEKYTNFAREALSNGDKIQYENYLQHADHYSRRLKEISTKEKTFEKSSELNSSNSNIVEENQSESNTSKETIKE